MEQLEQGRMNGALCSALIGFGASLERELFPRKTLSCLFPSTSLRTFQSPQAVCASAVIATAADLTNSNSASFIFGSASSRNVLPPELSQLVESKIQALKTDAEVERNLLSISRQLVDRLSTQ